MTQPWPFANAQETIEVLSWRTDVIRTKSAEQRIALRALPRRMLQVRHLFDHEAYAAARTMTRGAEAFLVPDWTQLMHIESVSAGSSVVIPADTTGVDLSPGDDVMIRRGNRLFEIAEVEAITASTITLDEVAAPVSKGLILPLLPAQAPEGLGAERPAGPWVSGSITFDVQHIPDISASDYPQYRGHDVMDVCPVVSSGSFGESVMWPVETIDADLGLSKHLRERTLPDERFMIRWHEFRRAGIHRLRKWLYSRRGKQKAFWASTFARDLTLANPIGASDTEINVFTLPGIANLARTNFDIEIRSQEGASYYRQVTNAVPGSPVDGVSSLVLTLNASVGVALATVRRISFMRCARFDADRVELLHRPGEGAACSVPCIEVPVP